MKKSLLLMAALAFAGAGAFEFELTNRANKASITAIKFIYEDGAETETIQTNVAPKAKVKINTPSGVTRKNLFSVTLFLSSDMKVYVEDIEDTKDFTSMSLMENYHLMKPKFETESRGDDSDTPVGKIYFSHQTNSKITGLCLSPTGKNQWKKCEVAKEFPSGLAEIYKVPKSGKFDVKITTNSEKFPEFIFDNSGEGYSIKEIEEFLLEAYEYSASVSNW